MSTDNVTPISAARAAPRAVAVSIEKLRQRLFQAMAFVETTEHALDENQLSERMTLEAAYKAMADIAEEMGEISGCPVEDD